MSARALASELRQARAMLRAAEQAEATERAALKAVVERERQVAYASEQAAGGIRTAKDWQGIEAARSRAGEAESARQLLIRARRDQEAVVKACQGRTREARTAIEALEQHATRLRRAMARGEQVVAMRERVLREGEEALTRAQDDLGRLQAALQEAQTTLDDMRRELSGVGDSDPDRPPI